MDIDFEIAWDTGGGQARKICAISIDGICRAVSTLTVKEQKYLAYQLTLAASMLLDDEMHML